MSLSNWYVSNYQVVKEENGFISRVSQEEFWQNRKNDHESNIGLNIMGFADISIVVREIAQKITISLGVKSESGFKVIDFQGEFPVDHIVLDKNWYPLDSDAMLYVNSELKRENISLGGEFDFTSYLKLVKIKNNSTIRIDFDFDLDKLSLSKTYKKLSSRLKAKPYDYQKTGIEWLTTMFLQRSGAILADEMGLGKTLQILGLIANIVEVEDIPKLKILIVVPSSLTMNWKREFEKFLPSVIPYIHKGKERVVDVQEFNELNVVITTYDLIKRDIFLFQSHSWNLVVCDEAQALKNRNSQQRVAIEKIPSLTKFLVTGTPVENSLRDLWSLIDLIRPGLMGNYNLFTRLVEDDFENARNIGESVKSLILRRRVKEVGDQLPEIVYIDNPIDFSNNFADSYESIRLGTLNGLNGNPNLGSLTKLRQFCCYPVIVDRNFDPQDNPKMDRLFEVLDEIFYADDDQVIIFTSFTESINYIEYCLKSRYGDLWVGIIDGRNSAEERDQLIIEFSSLNKFSVLIISPKAGGKGLDITAANHVIHYNLEWNPATEDQATARAWRTGQKKTVFAHRFYFANTLEQIIYDRLTFKADLAFNALQPSEKDNLQKDFKAALSISPIVI